MSDDLIKEKFEDHERRIINLEQSTKILSVMEIKLSSMEENIKSINKKLDEKIGEKGKKWDKLIDYLFYAVLGIMISYIAFKIGAK